MRIVLDNLDPSTFSQWRKSYDGPDAVDVDFGAIQAAKVPAYARGRDIKGSLLLNYRGPFTIRFEEAPEEVLSTASQELQQLIDRTENLRKTLTTQLKQVKALNPVKRKQLTAGRKVKTSKKSASKKAPKKTNDSLLPEESE